MLKSRRLSPLLREHLPGARSTQPATGGQPAAIRALLESLCAAFGPTAQPGRARPGCGHRQQHRWGMVVAAGAQRPGVFAGAMVLECRRVWQRGQTAEPQPEALLERHRFAVLADGHRQSGRSAALSPDRSPLGNPGGGGPAAGAADRRRSGAAAFLAGSQQGDRPAAGTGRSLLARRCQMERTSRIQRRPPAASGGR